MYNVQCHQILIVYTASMYSVATVLIVYTASMCNVQCHQIVIVYTALEKVRFPCLKTAEM